MPTQSCANAPLLRHFIWVLIDGRVCLAYRPVSVEFLREATGEAGEVGQELGAPLTISNILYKNLSFIVRENVLRVVSLESAIADRLKRLRVLKNFD